MQGGKRRLAKFMQGFHWIVAKVAQLAKNMPLKK